MEEAVNFFDLQEESCRVVSRFGKPNPRQITEEEQRREETLARRENRGGQPPEGPPGP